MIEYGKRYRIIVPMFLLTTFSFSYSFKDNDIPVIDADLIAKQGN